MKKEHASRQSVESVEAASPPCEDTDVHRPTLVIKFKQVASTGDGMKQRLRHVKTWTSTIKNADTPTSISDTQINGGAEDSFGASKEREVGKEVRRHSDGNENAGVPIGAGTRGGNIVQNGRCVREKGGIPAKKPRSFSESTMPTKHDNIFQQMSTIIPGSRMSEPTLGLDAKHDSFNSEMDTSCDLFDSDHEMILEDDVPLASLKSKFAIASGVRNTEAHRNGLPNDAHSQLVSGNGSCSALDDFPPSISESNSRRSFSRRSASRDSSESRIDEPVIEPQKSLQRDSAYDEGTTDDIAGNAMPHLVSNRPTSPDVDRPDVGALPHLEPSSESSFRSPSEMPILIDETQTNDLEALDLFGQWRPNATDDGEMELVSEVGENPSELVSEVGGKPSELVAENPLELGPEVGVKPSELVPEVGRKPSTLWEAGTVSRGGCRVKLPSTGSGTTRNDVAPRTDGRVELANDTTCEIPDRPRTGCRVKLPRSTSESDGTSVARVKSTVRMLLPRSACPSEEPPNLTGLPETSPIMETSYTTEATVKRKPSAVFLADMRLKLSLKKKRKRKRERLPKCDKSHEIENWAVDSPAVSYASYVMFEDEVKLPMEGSNDCVSDPAEESEAAPKSPLETSELTATDAGLTPNQNASCSSLLDGKIIKRKKNRLSLPRKSISDGSLHGRKMVAFSAVPPITNYAGGRRVTCGQLVNGQVWLTRRHFKEYDLKKVGSETLLLQCLAGDDVAELKVQILQEEAHRRKEKRSTSTIGFDMDVHDASVDSDDEPLLKYVATPGPKTEIDAKPEPVDLGVGGDSQSPDLGVGGDSRSPDLGAGGDSRSKFGICSLFSGAAASEVHNMEVVAVRSGAVFRKHCKVVLKAKRRNKSPSKSKHIGSKATGKKKTQDNTSLSLPDKPDIDESRPAKDSQSTTEEAKLNLSKKKRHRYHRNTGHLKKASDKDESQSKHVTDDSTIMHTAVDIHEESKNVADVSKTVADIQKESINSLFDCVIDDPMEAVNGDAESNFLVDHSVDDPTEAVDEGGGMSKEGTGPPMDHSVDDPSDVMDKDTDICKESDDPLMDHVVGDRTETIYEDADVCKEKSNSHGHHSIHDPSKAVDENADTCKESINSLMDRAIGDPIEAVNVTMSLPDKSHIHKSHPAKDSQSKTKEAKLKSSKRKHHHHRRRVTSGHLKKVSDKDESKSKHVTDDSKTMKTVVDIHKENKNVTDVLKTIADIQKESINSLFDRVIDDPMEAVNGDAESNFLVDHSADDPTEAVDEGGGTSKESSDPPMDHAVDDPTETMDKDIDTCKESSDPMMDHAVDDPTEALYEDADVCKEKSNSHGHHSIHDPSKAVDENADTCKESINSRMDLPIDDPIEAVNVAMSLPDKPDVHKSRHAKDSQRKTKEAKLKPSKRKHHHHRRVTSGHLKKVSDKDESKSKHVTDDSKTMKTVVDIHKENKNVTDVLKTVADIHKESINSLFDRVIDDPMDAVNGDAESNFLMDHSIDDPTEAVDEGGGTSKDSSDPPMDHAVDDPTETMDKDIDTCKESTDPMMDHAVDDPTEAIYEDADVCKEKSNSHGHHSVHDPSKAVDENADTRKESINSCMDRAIDDPIEAVNVAMSLPDKSHIHKSHHAKDSQSTTKEAKLKLSKRKHHHRRRVTSGHLKKVSDKSKSKHVTDDSKTIVDIHQESRNVTDVSKTVADIHKESSDPLVDHVRDGPTEAVDAGTCKVSNYPMIDHSLDDLTEAMDKDTDTCKWSSNSIVAHVVGDPTLTLDEDSNTCKQSSDPHVDHSVHDPSKAVDENADTHKESINSLMDRAIDDPIEAVNVAMSLPDKSHIPESRPAKDSQSKTEEAKLKPSKRKHHHHRRRVTSGHLKKVSDKDESRSKHMTDDSKTMTTVVDIHKGCTNSPIDDADDEPTGAAVHKDIDICKMSSIPLVDQLVNDPTEAIYEESDVYKEKSNSHGDRAVDNPKEAVDNDIDTCKESRDPTMDHTTDAVDDPTGDDDADVCKESSNNSPVDHAIDDPLEAVYEDVDSIPLVDHKVDDLAEAVVEDAGTSRESSDLFVDHSVDDPAKALDEGIDSCKESINSLMDRTIDDPIEAVNEDAESDPLVDHSVDDLAETVDEDIDTCKVKGDPSIDHTVDDSTEAVDDPTVVKDADICKESSNSPLDHTIGDPIDPVVDHSVHDPAKAVDEDTDAWKSIDNSFVDHSVDNPINAVAEGTNTPSGTLASSISLVDYAIEEDYSSVVEYRTGSRTSVLASKDVCADQTADVARTEKVECARDLAKKSDPLAAVITVTDVPCRNMQDSDVKSAISNSVSSQSVSNDRHPCVHETVQAANSRTEDVTNCTVELEITRLNRLLEDVIPDVCAKTNVTGTPSDQPQAKAAEPHPKAAEPHPAVKQALALIHRRRQEASLPGPTVTSLVHLEEAAASCRYALGERPMTSCAEPRHDRKRISESRDSPQRKRKHSSSCGDDDDHKTGRGDMRERAGSGSGHRSGSSRKEESFHKSGTSTSSHRSGNSREPGCDNRSDKRHRSESSHRSESGRGSESSHRSESGRGSESSHRSEKEHRYESSRRSGSDHRSGNSHRPESDHRSSSSHRSEKERRSEGSHRSGSDHRSDTSSYKSGSSSHRSEGSSHRSGSDHISGSSHRSDTSSHRSESVRGSGNDDKLRSRLKTVPESSALGQEHSDSVARNDNSTERNNRVHSEEPSEASSCQQQGYVGRNTKHKLPEDISPPGVSTMKTHDICTLPSSLPSMPPLVREASPESDRNVSAGSPLRQTDGLSPPKLTAQPWHLIEIDNTRAGGRHGGSKKKRKKSEDKTIKDSSKAPSFLSGESVLFSSGSNVGDGSTDDRRRARNGCRQDGATWSRQEDRNDDKHCRTGENCKSGNKTRIASDNDTTQMQDRSGHSIVASDGDLFSLSSHQRLSGQSIHRERNFQLSDTSGDDVQELVSEVGLKPNDGHRWDKSQVSQDCCDRSLAKKSRDSFDCHDGGSDDTPNSSRGKPAKNSHVSDHGRHTDSRVSDNRHRTTGRRSSHRSDSEHSADDNRPEGAFRHSRGVIITPAVAPPTRETVTADIGLLSGPQLKEPYCSNPSDIPDRPR